MHPMRRWWTAALLAALTAAGCASSRPRPSAATGPPTSPTTGPTITTTAAPTTRGAGATPAGGADWVTYQHNAARRGETADGPASAQIAQKWATPAGGDVYAQPLVVGHQIIVATEADTVVALAVGDGHVVWRTTVGTPVPLSSLPCGDVDPSGITSTPVADPSTNTVWVADETGSPIRHELVSLDLTTGAIKARRTVDPPGSDPKAQQIRAALTLLGGSVYVPLGGLFGDCGSYRGYVVGARVDGTGGLAVWQVADPAGGGGIWTTSGATVAGGALLVATGNSRSTNAYADGDSVVRLTPALQKADEFAPSNWAQLNASDGDLNTSGPAVVGRQILQVGKDATGYLLNLDHLGGIGGQVAKLSVCRAFGGTAQANGMVYEPCTDGLAAVTVGPGTLSLAWATNGYDGGTPIVAGHVVWQLDVSGGRLYGYDATSGQRLATAAVGPVHHFAPVAAGDGLLVVAGQDRIVAFG